MMEVGGFFFEFEANTMLRAGERAGNAALEEVVQPARSIAVSRRGPNGLEFEKETTHDLLSWRRVASMA